MLVRAHVFIAGRVQGVSYRYYTKQEAEALGLVGWARNIRNGKLKIENGQLTKVEAVFEGEKARVEEMIEWCKEGSSSAQVSKVEVKWGNPEDLEGFEIRSSV